MNRPFLMLETLNSARERAITRVQPDQPQCLSGRRFRLRNRRLHLLCELEHCGSGGSDIGGLGNLSNNRRTHNHPICDAFQTCNLIRTANPKANSKGQF
jgi:hypothetical protein